MLPAASVAEQVAVVVPIGRVLPDGGRQVTAGCGGFWSVAETVQEIGAPPGPVASIVRLAGSLTWVGVVAPGVPMSARLCVLRRLAEEEPAAQGFQAGQHGREVGLGQRNLLESFSNGHLPSTIPDMVRSEPRIRNRKALS